MHHHMRFKHFDRSHARVLLFLIVVAGAVQFAPAHAKGSGLGGWFNCAETKIG